MLRPDAERKRRCRTGNAPAHIRETADKKMHPGITSTVHPDYAFTRTALLQQTQTPGLRPGAIVTVRTIRIRSRIFRRHTQRPRRPKRLRDSGAARTRDPQLRRLLLYPTELRNLDTKLPAAFGAAESYKSNVFSSLVQIRAAPGSKQAPARPRNTPASAAEPLRKNDPNRHRASPTALRRTLLLPHRPAWGPTCRTAPAVRK